jgi:hypothetical protein
MENVTVEFVEGQSRSFEPGVQVVSLELNRDIRSLTTTTELYVIKPIDYVTIELACPDESLDPLDFVANASIALSVGFDLEFETELPDLTSLSAGSEPIGLVLNRAHFQSAIIVQDTTAPFILTQYLVLPMGERFTPECFVVEIIDASPIEYVGFVYEPDAFISGEQVIEIIAIDAFGNEGASEAILHILPNTVYPTLLGVESFEATINTSIRYRDGVTAFDAFGRTLEINVDSSQVDTTTPGLYNVRYWVEDAWGLRTEVEIYVRMIEVDPEEVRERVDYILSEIMQEEMTQVEQARAIFDWVSRNVHYAGDVHRDSIYEGAFQALQHRRGNCFIFYSISEVMLTRAGIPNMRIERIPGPGNRHAWNLINPDEMGWHHFDSLGTRIWIDRFMFTSSQAVIFSQMLAEAGASLDYYTYDPALYPEIVWS